MKIYYIEDNVFLHKQFMENANKYLIQNVSTIEVPKVNQLEAFYNELPKRILVKSDVFIIDISLNSYHSGIDFAKRIRSIQENCSIIFLTNDTSKGIEIINTKIRPDKYLIKRTWKL